MKQVKKNIAELGRAVKNHFSAFLPRAEFSRRGRTCTKSLNLWDKSYRQGRWFRIAFRNPNSELKMFFQPQFCIKYKIGVQRAVPHPLGEKLHSSIYRGEDDFLIWSWGRKFLIYSFSTGNPKAWALRASLRACCLFPNIS